MVKSQLIQRIIITTTLAIAITSSGLTLTALTVKSVIAQSTTKVVATTFRAPSQQTNQNPVGSTDHSTISSRHRVDGGPLG